MPGEGEQSGLATEKEWLAFINGWIKVRGKLVSVNELRRAFLTYA